MKDNFSSSSDKYAQYRPTYPQEVFDLIYSLTPNKQNAWDCGTGNGQVAGELARTFENVYATDISKSQLENAIKLPNVHYSIQPAEKTDFKESLFDLVVVAQAIHWFDFDKFYREVKRTSQPNAILAVIGYGRVEINKEIDILITQFYKDVIGKYWDAERRYIDEHYQTLPFPFKEIEVPTFVNKLYWSLEHLTGYLNTWSAVKHFIQKNGHNPITDLRIQLEKYWDNGDLKEVRFPIFLKLGEVN